jgi:hypothetical protein
MLTMLVKRTQTAAMATKRDGSATQRNISKAVDAAVERHGGDLMVDEPVNGDSPREPDDPRFVLPTRSGNESVDTFITRVVMATERATR